MHLALTGLFRAKWSADIHEEWMSNLLKNGPDLTRAKLERTRTLMDRHVLAAAIRGNATIIVTLNRRHFPAQIIAPFGLEAQHPDAFVMRLLNHSPLGVVEAAQNHRESLKNPPKSLPEYLETLHRQGLTETAAMLGQSSGVVRFAKNAVSSPIAL
jgi:hypothetical protein